MSKRSSPTCAGPLPPSSLPRSPTTERYLVHMLSAESAPARARRALAGELPESVASAVWEFLRGPLANDPQRVGKPLVGQLQGLWSARRGGYRVVYRIDDDTITVIVVRIGHRRDVDRSR